jgi:PhnB protein
MAKVSTYLNFNRDTEAAFNFYKQVFGGEFAVGVQWMLNCTEITK